MKKITLITLLIAFALHGFSQKKSRKYSVINDTSSVAIHIVKEPRFLINIHSGYAIGMGSTFKFYPDDISAITVTQVGYNTPAKTATYANPTKGLGDGFKFGFGGSYIINDFINVGLDFDYFNSTIKKYRDSTFHQTNIPVPSPLIADESYYSEHNTLSYDATLLSLTPNITFKAISRPKWFLYNKVGAIITFRPNSIQNDVTQVQTSMGWQGYYKDTSTNITKKYEWVINNPAYGFLGAIGAQVKVADKFRAFAEVQFSHTVFVIHKRTLTDYVVDKQHIEGSFPVSMRELEFVKSFSSNASGSDPNKPSQTIVQRIPIDYVGLQVGLTYQLK
ncbi:MAG: hypothetical protein ABI707_03420 [Ferruginibacter sp.]